MKEATLVCYLVDAVENPKIELVGYLRMRPRNVLSALFKDWEIVRYRGLRISPMNEGLALEVIEQKNWEEKSLGEVERDFPMGARRQYGFARAEDAKGEISGYVHDHRKREKDFQNRIGDYIEIFDALGFPMTGENFMRSITPEMERPMSSRTPAPELPVGCFI